MYPEHEVGNELKGISQWPDEHRDVLELVSTDVGESEVQATGRKGLSIESVLRCGILKQYHQLTYDDLAFCPMDSMACQAFARLDHGWTPQKTALQMAISRVSSTTWEKIDRCLLLSALNEKAENGKMVPINCTVTESNIHAPTDTSLLFNVMVHGMHPTELMMPLLP